LREHLREQADPAVVWKAIQSGLDSTNEREKLAAAKLLLSELYEPAAERQREDEAEAARARAKFELTVDAIARRRILQGLVEAGVIRPGGGMAFEGAVMFELRELAEWVGHWTPRPLEISDVTCSMCGKAGVRIVKEGEAVDGGPVYCATCKAAVEEATASSPEESIEAATWPRGQRETRLRRRSRFQSPTVSVPLRPPRTAQGTAASGEPRRQRNRGHARRSLSSCRWEWGRGRDRAYRRSG
jgi:hypothetical protein